MWRAMDHRLHMSNFLVEGRWSKSKYARVQIECSGLEPWMSHSLCHLHRKVHSRIINGYRRTFGAA